MSKAFQDQLITALPVGLVASRHWLTESGCAERSIDNWLLSGRIRAIYPGVYVRPDTKLTWQGLVISLPRLFRAEVHVGGMSALDLFGMNHYLPLGDHKTVHLYSATYCPNWLKKVLAMVPNVDFVWHSTKRLWVNPLDEALFRDWIWREELPVLHVASAELAFLEILEMVPKQCGFSAVDELMQGLSTLSPRRLQSVLRQCESVKAKRLFFWLSDRHKHTWRAELDPSKFMLGSGKRVIHKEGRLNKSYQITVPRDMESNDEV